MIYTNSLTQSEIICRDSDSFVFVSNRIFSDLKSVFKVDSTLFFLAP